MTKKRFLIVSCVLALVSGIAAIGLMPPPNALTRIVKGKAFYSGVIYLTAHSDTIGLKKFGFRDFEFEGRSVGTVRYHTLWPQTVVLDSLPSAYQNIEFDIAPPDTTPDLNTDSGPDNAPIPEPESINPEPEPTPPPKNP